MRHGNRQRRTPLSDEAFERALYAAGELSDQDLARAGSMRRIRQPLSDAAFERQMRAEEAGKQAAPQKKLSNSMRDTAWVPSNNCQHYTGAVLQRAKEKAEQSGRRLILN